MTNYPDAIDDTTTLPPGTGDDAQSINALIEAVEAIEIELGITPSGIYASTRTRLDILEARINNPFAPAPNVENPFFIGDTGVSISVGDGSPTENRVDGSLYLRMDGTSNTAVYTHQDGYWSVLGASISGTAGGDLSGLYPDPIVVGLNGLPLSNVIPTTGQVLMWNGSFWTPGSSAGGFTAGGDLSGTSTNQTVIGLQTTPVSSTTPSNGQFLVFNGTHWLPENILSNIYTVPVGVNISDAVYSTGNGLADQARANSLSSVPVIGFVLSKPTTTSAVIQYYGEVGGFSGLTAGDTYYLSDLTAGLITTTAPTTSGSIVQRVGFAKDTNTLVAMIDRDFILL